MTHLYITDNGSVLGVEGGKLVIKQKNALIRSLPKESIESISIFGNSTITTPCMQQLLMNNVPVCFFSSKGKYFGRLEATTGSKVNLLKRQFEVLAEESYVLSLSKQLIIAKINNQLVLLRRYLTVKCEETDRKLALIKQMMLKVYRAESLTEIMGYEGMAARIYFEILSDVVRPEFKFYGRNRRPPRDPFNSLLSLGYTLLMYEIFSKVEIAGLNPYCGILHQDRDGSPALASDLMEEWRPVIVDSVAMSMIQGNEIKLDDFISDEEATGIYLNNAALKKYITKFEKKLNTPNRYLAYDENKYTFRQAMDIQCSKIVESIKTKDPGRYRAIQIR